VPPHAASTNAVVFATVLPPIATIVRPEAFFTCLDPPH
jgi:hypothetical protein